MPVTVKERNSGRRQTGKGAERRYVIRGATDGNAALTALLSDIAVPTIIGSFTRTDAECGVEELAEDLYEGTAVYGIPDGGGTPQQPETFSITFDISGQAVRITQARKHVNDYAPSGKTPKNFQGAINVQQDGTVEGVDIIVPFMSFVVTYTFAQNNVDQDYILTLTDIVGTVNDGSFHQFKAGELLLTRVNGQKRSDGNWDISFGFSVSRDKSDLKIGEGGDQITIPTKKGWDYLWVRYENREVGTAPDIAVHKVPVSAHVEQVYDYKSYNALKI